MPAETSHTNIMPPRLAEIPDAPKTLYYKGAWDEGIFERCLAVVGARQMTGYGRRAVEQIVGEVAAAGVTIVSGFMYGIDAVAHKAAVDAGGRTIAVMPCGIERVHPAYQKDLYNRILDTDGLVISEYEGDSQPQNWTYPRRNRIVAGLSHAVLVVEAGLKSGSLITANYAAKYQREIFAVPGPITSNVSQGTLKLIKEGAEPVARAEDIARFYATTANRLRTTADAVDGSRNAVSDLGAKILRELKSEPQGTDMLARELGVSAAEIGTALSLLELSGRIAQEGEKYYINV